MSSCGLLCRFAFNRFPLRRLRRILQTRQMRQCVLQAVFTQATRSYHFRLRLLAPNLCLHSLPNRVISSPKCVWINISAFRSLEALVVDSSPKVSTRLTLAATSTTSSSLQYIACHSPSGSQNDLLHTRKNILTQTIDASTTQVPQASASTSTPTGRMSSLSLKKKCDY